MKIEDMPNFDKPYEKAKQFGVKSLTDKELLAILIRSGTKKKSALDIAQELLKDSNDKISLTNLYRKSLYELMDIKGIGEVKAIQIKSLLELSIRISMEKYPRGPLLNSPSIIAEYYMEKLRHLDYEVLWLLCFDTKGELLKDKEMFKGSVNSCSVSSREIFIEALRCKAVNIILMHNHPSGDITPSKEDISFTNNIKNIGDIMNIKLWDHIILGDIKYCSLKEEGLI